MSQHKRSSRAPRVSHNTRLAKISVLVADRDARTASLINTVLRSFGFMQIDLVTEPAKALEAMARKPYGLIITEWHLAEEDGIALVKAIRGPLRHPLMRRDIPVIMLTAKSDVQSVKVARDAGITEFLAKPFTAHTLSHRLIQVIDHPRLFVEAEGYTGPCRRRRGEPPPGEGERRGVRKPVDELPPNFALREMLGVPASDIFTEELIRTAQEELQKQEPVFISWANDDILQLEGAFRAMLANPGDSNARELLLRTAYAIKSQAGMFGYDLGTQIARNLIDYMEKHERIEGEQFTILRKHIDTMAVIFHQKIKQTGQELGAELVASLHKLIEKLG